MKCHFPFPNKLLYPINCTWHCVLIQPENTSISFIAKSCKKTNLQTSCPRSEHPIFACKATTSPRTSPAPTRPPWPSSIAWRSNSRGADEEWTQERFHTSARWSFQSIRAAEACRSEQPIMRNWPAKEPDLVFHVRLRDRHEVVKSKRPGEHCLIGWLCWIHSRFSPTPSHWIRVSDNPGVSCTSHKVSWLGLEPATLRHFL